MSKLSYPESHFNTDFIAIKILTEEEEIKYELHKGYNHLNASYVLEGVPVMRTQDRKMLNCKKPPFNAFHSDKCTVCI
jgi:hypothetical protein